MYHIYASVGRYMYTYTYAHTPITLKNTHSLSHTGETQVPHIRYCGGIYVYYIHCYTHTLSHSHTHTHTRLVLHLHTHKQYTYIRVETRRSQIPLSESRNRSSAQALSVSRFSLWRVGLVRERYACFCYSEDVLVQCVLSVTKACIPLSRQCGRGRLCQLYQRGPLAAALPPPDASPPPPEDRYLVL